MKMFYKIFFLLVPVVAGSFVLPASRCAVKHSAKMSVSSSRSIDGRSCDGSLYFSSPNRALFSGLTGAMALAPFLPESPVHKQMRDLKKDMAAMLAAGGMVVFKPLEEYEAADDVVGKMVHAVKVLLPHLLFLCEMNIQLITPYCTQGGQKQRALAENIKNIFAGYARFLKRLAACDFTAASGDAPFNQAPLNGLLDAAVELNSNPMTASLPAVGTVMSKEQAEFVNKAREAVGVVMYAYTMVASLWISLDGMHRYVNNWFPVLSYAITDPVVPRGKPSDEPDAQFFMLLAAEPATDTPELPDMVPGKYVIEPLSKRVEGFAVILTSRLEKDKGFARWATSLWTYAHEKGLKKGTLSDDFKDFKDFIASIVHGSFFDHKAVKTTA